MTVTGKSSSSELNGMREEVMSARWAVGIVSGVVAALAFVGIVPEAEAQLRPSYSEGQNVSPAYEGWLQHEDGSRSIVFGYMNRNWEEEPVVPIGPENQFSPGPADRGQPTRFLPRRNRFVFEVPVGDDFAQDDELVWTLTVNGETERAYGSLNPEYLIDNVVIMSETGALGAGTSDENIRSNEPPEIELEGAMERTVRVGEPLTLVAEVIDDGLPPERGVSRPEPDATPEQLLRRAMNPPVRVTVNKTVALHFTWFVYRGPGEVSFDPPQVKPWEDTRPFANSPWAPFWIPPDQPEDGRWMARAVFHEPGTYVLRGRADDGGLYSDIEVTVHVSGDLTP